MIDNVQKGGKITASAQNQLINEVNNLIAGNASSNNTNYGRMTDKDVPPCLFQVKTGKGYVMTGRPATYEDTLTSTTHIMLGNSLCSMMMNIGYPQKAYVFNDGNQAAAGEIGDGWFKVNGSDRAYTGWIDLQYPTNTPVYAAFAEEYDTEGKKVTSAAPYFCIDSLSTAEGIAGHFREYVSTENELSVTQIVCLANYTEPGQLRGTSGSSPQISYPVQMHTGVLYLSAEEGDGLINVDSELSDTKLCSIQWNEISGEKFVQLYDFPSLSTQLSSLDTMFKKYGILVREGDTTYGNVLKYADVSAVLAPGDTAIDEVYLSSIQLKERNTKLYYELYRFDDPDTDLQLVPSDVESLTGIYKILVRDGNQGKLRYAALSGFGGGGGGGTQVSTDSECYERATVGTNSIEYRDDNGKFIQLYDFDDPPQLNLDHQDIEPSEYNRYKVLVRDGDSRTLAYATFNPISGSGVSGDANVGDAYSISAYDGEVGLYEFKNGSNTRATFSPELGCQTYFTGGKGTIIQNDTSSNFLARKPNSDGVYELGYRVISTEVPPFTHGDADSYVNGLTERKSIDAYVYTAGQQFLPVGNFRQGDDPSKVHYQLHNWRENQYTTIDNDIISSHYIDLANGRKMSEGSHTEQFLVRDTSTGTLEYRQIKLKGDEASLNRLAGDIQNIQATYGPSITIISGDLQVISGDLSAVKQQISSISDDYWPQGGDHGHCYGTAIGDGNKAMAINLAQKSLVGNWTVDGNLTATNLNASNTVYGTDGDFSNTLTVDAGIYTADTYTGSLHSNGSNDIVVQNNLYGDDSQQIAGFTKIAACDGGILQIGNTTLNEQQLIRLLSLI